ncbi:GntR family transcriptional regulator [Streptomyces sp. F-3]|uniref:GntR family transcriptional regulator n=1 Tax=Streptomyces thermogriseus TaxID=75292 RepID=A0ABP4DL49_9ACTN|nr:MULTISPECIES: FCD domain-containing protein [Streptomyces]MDN5382553.1 FCD domain-containing protein [Streptomyces sp. LB8]GAT81918.1 GntR family transcriptional regulator [Streptomyces sp. F-3]
MAADGVPVMRTSLISPLNAGGRVEEVVERISRAIMLGLVVDGEQLPPEVNFAHQLGVSPMTLREALAILRQQGLVETRRGRNGGTFVRRPANPPLDALEERLRSTTVSELRDFADEQFAVCGAAALLAAERASAANVRRMLHLVEQLAAAEGVGDRIRADSRFHLEIAMASQSERLTQLEVALQAELTPMLWLPLETRTSTDDAVAEHHAIATAIAEEDGERARALAERHVRRNLRRLIELHLTVAGR